jgi:hypothetical protein
MQQVTPLGWILLLHTLVEPVLKHCLLLPMRMHYLLCLLFLLLVVVVLMVPACLEAGQRQSLKFGKFCLDV